MVILCYTNSKKEQRQPDLDIDLIKVISNFFSFPLTKIFTKVGKDFIVPDRQTAPSKLYQFYIQYAIEGIPGRKLFLATESMKARTRIIQKLVKLVETVKTAYRMQDYSSPQGGDLSIVWFRFFFRRLTGFFSQIGTANLLQAATVGNLADVTYLLPSLPVDRINGKSRMGHTALMCASREGFLEVVEALLNVKGIEVNEQDVDGHTALHGKN
jgi:hypothetical protein